MSISASIRDWFDGKGLIARQLVEDRKATGERQKGGELKDDRADIAALRCMIYCCGVGTAHMQEELKDWTEVVLGEATNSRYTWVAVNSASAELVVASHRGWSALAHEERDTQTVTYIERIERHEFRRVWS
jgi:hypothetical protein